MAIISCAIQYIFVAYLFYREVSKSYLIPLPCPSILPSPHWQPLVYSLCLWICFSFAIYLHMFYFLDPHISYVIDCLFMCYISLSIIFFRSNHTATNGRISFFLRLSNISLCINHVFFLFVCFCFFFLLSFRASVVAYGRSRVRGWIGAVATGLHHSHSNLGSEHHLQPTPQLMATPNPQPTEQGQGSNLHPYGC